MKRFVLLMLVVLSAKVASPADSINDDTICTRLREVILTYIEKQASESTTYKLLSIDRIYQDTFEDFSVWATIHESTQGTPEGKLLYLNFEVTSGLRVKGFRRYDDLNWYSRFFTTEQDGNPSYYRILLPRDLRHKAAKGLTDDEIRGVVQSALTSELAKEIRKHEKHTLVGWNRELIAVDRIYELKNMGKHLRFFHVMARVRWQSRASGKVETQYDKCRIEVLSAVGSKLEDSRSSQSLEWYEQAIKEHDRSESYRIVAEGAAQQESDSRLSPLALAFFASDPTPAVAGKDFRILFAWSAKPDSVHIDLYSPSGEHVMKKVVTDENELFFPARVYTKFLTERGRFSLKLEARKSGHEDYETSLAFDLVDPSGIRGWFTLGPPDKEAIYFGETVQIPIFGLSEPRMPMNIYLVGPKGAIHEIVPGTEDRKGEIFCKFNSWSHQKHITEPGEYRFKVQTILAGQRFITRFSDPFTYLVADKLKREISLDGKIYELHIDSKASEPLWYYERTANGQLRCDQMMNKRLQKLAGLKGSEDEEIWTITPWLKSRGRSYAAFAFCAKGTSLETYKPGQVFWLNKQGLRQTGAKRLVLLDEISQVVTDTEFAKALFRAAFVYYQAVAVSNSGLIINSQDINYVRSMTENPAFAATFLAQAGKSLLTLPEERYKALFLDVMLAETDDVYLTREQRKTIAQSLESGGDINKALSTYAKIARRLPSNYVKKLDENWVMVRRGEQWHFLRRKNMPNVGRGIRLLEVAVELTHNQIVLQGRAEKLDLIDSEIINHAPSGKSRAMKIGTQEAIKWSDKAYKSGLSNALDKVVEVAKKEGIEAALKLLGQMSSKANSVLLAFEIPNVVFNMDSMYDSNIKAQCVADVSEAINDALITAVKKAESSKDIEEWEHVDALYLFAYLAKERFHYHAANMLESSGIGKDAGDFLTQGKTTQWITSQKNTSKGISSMIEYWEKEECINDCIELMVTQVSSKQQK